MGIRQKKHCTAIVLSAGRGKRMHASVEKQYIELYKRPVIYYTLEIFQSSSIIDDIVLVVGKGQEEEVYEKIVRKYHFSKVKAVVEGGAERYASVWNGLQAIADGRIGEESKTGYVFIHDGARPFVTENILRRGYDTVCKCRACVAGMPSKDTIKIVDDKTYSTATVKLADDQGFVGSTPDRKSVWMIQTPQIFETELITDAYSRLMGKHAVQVTDDAMVLEQMLKMPVKLFEGSYENIKITTPEDLDIAKMFLLERRRQG